jgi:hypothetical protein
LRDDKNVGKDNRSIDEAFVPLNGLESKGGCNLGAAAAFEEIVLALRLVVLGQIATSYAW